MSGQDVLNETLTLTNNANTNVSAPNVYTVQPADVAVFVEGATAAFTVSLPNPAALTGATAAQGKAWVGRNLLVAKDAAAFTITINVTGGGSTIFLAGGATPVASTTLASGTMHNTTFLSDGTNWYQIGTPA
jgi:hypothetical protein